MLLIAILLPLAAGVLMYLLKLKDYRTVCRCTAVVTLITSVLVWALILTCGEEGLTFLRMSGALELRLRFDSMGRFFAGIIATLWPLTILYAFEYMVHEERKGSFFAFFTMSYGVTLGVAMSANIFTMYFFYELLTLVTLPLVIHTMEKKAIRAARTYLSFSLAGAAFAFVAVVFLVVNGMGGDFALGGLLTGGAVSGAHIVYLMGFMGFGVKAAVFPTHVWLPKAAVAPTPVTALLHAVAVVKSGAFAIMRLTYFSFDPNQLRGSWAQYVVMGLAMFTIFYGAAKAVKERHFKRRLAYSTVANLSYILFAATIMTKGGLAAALLHMAFHAEIKILSFFAAGAVLHGTGREYSRELEGLGKRMPLTLGSFTVAALALVGIPPFSGFVSKWSILTAAAASGQPLAYAGAGVILCAALMTAVYMLTNVRRIWFPSKGTDLASLDSVHEVNWKMTVPMVILAASILLTGLFAHHVVDAVTAIAAGLS